MRATCPLATGDCLWRKRLRVSRSGCPVGDGRNTRLARAIGATVNLPGAFDPMPDDSAVTVGTLRRERLNCALETVEYMFLTVHFDAECLVVIVATHFTASHNGPPKLQFFFDENEWAGVLCNLTVADL